MNLDNLDERRKIICLKFAKNCLKNEKVKGLFPKIERTLKMKLRKERKFKTNKKRTERYKKSTIPYMQELLSNEVNFNWYRLFKHQCLYWFHH